MADAATLGCSRSLLWNVLSGRLVNPTLKARYEALKAAQGPPAINPVALEGEFLKREMERRGLTVRSLARLAGTHNEVITNIISGHHRWWKARAAINRALGCEVFKRSDRLNVRRQRLVAAQTARVQAARPRVAPPEETAGGKAAQVKENPASEAQVKENDFTGGALPDGGDARR